MTASPTPVVKIDFLKIRKLGGRAQCEMNTFENEVKVIRLTKNTLEFAGSARKSQKAPSSALQTR